MSPDDRTALLEREPPDEIERLLMLLGPAEQRVARSLLSYGSGTVGRLMTPDFVTIQRDWTVAQVLDHIRRFVATARRSMSFMSPTNNTG